VDREAPPVFVPRDVVRDDIGDSGDGTGPIPGARRDGAGDRFPTEKRPQALRERVVGRKHGDAVRRQRPEQLALGVGDRLARAEQLDVRQPDAGDHAHGRAGDLGEPGDLAGAAHAHFQHDRLVLLV
jgi:hypothetical protein